MANALMIRGMDFSVNKLATVTVDRTIPCEGIALDESSVSMTRVGSTVKLTATVAPLNTTDTVVWSSSNNNIATVSEGTVTQTGVGTATIYAECGQQIASCTVTAVNVLPLNTGKSAAVKSGNIGLGFDYVTVYAGSDSYCALYGTEQTPYKLNNDSSGISGNLYPLRLGGNASTITVTAPSGVYVTQWQVDCNTVCDYGRDNPTTPGAYLAKYITGDSSPYDRSYGDGNRTITVAEGANAVALCLFHFQGTLTDEEIAAVTATVS